jgi:hypothetical protein
MSMKSHGGNRQRGTASVEFSLVAAIFMLLIMGIIEGGRVVFAWNAAAEATRAGARMASISTMGSPKVEEAMRKVLADLKSSQIDVQYLPSGCNPDDCEWIRVSIEGYAIKPVAVPVSLFPVPSARTTVKRESLGIVL